MSTSRKTGGIRFRFVSINMDIKDKERGDRNVQSKPVSYWKRSHYVAHEDIKNIMKSLNLSREKAIEVFNASKDLLPEVNRILDEEEEEKSE